jgi:L-fucose isomerase-like protein
MESKRSRFVLFFGNRGFFPASLISDARRQLHEVLTTHGHETILMPEDATRFGAVETLEEGRRFAAFLEEHRGAYDGVLLCLPNFGDEIGAAEALQNAGVPIFVQAYPDEMEKLAPAYRRDAFCGKFAMMDVCRQRNIAFTAQTPHVAHPESEAFAANLDFFDRVCRTVAGMKRLRIGAIGARTTPFQSVRIDELALQRHGITVQTYDMASIIAEAQRVDVGSPEYGQKAAQLMEYSDWSLTPKESFTNLCRLGVTLDAIIERDQLDAAAIRCWLELQQQLKISPCVLLSVLNEQGFPFACEVDVGSAVAMRALSLASGNPPTCLDWNNNYGDDPEKCIVFHCGPVPQSMMRGKGQIRDHLILANAVGHNCSFGSNVGRIKPAPITFGNVLSEDGRLRMYLGEGQFTDDLVPPEFFGTAGVAQIANLQNVLLKIGNEGFRHHVAVTTGRVLEPLHEALTKYLGFELLTV